VSNTALRDLIVELQNAHAGERAAGHAYAGHWRSVSDPAERAHIQKIEKEEWHHRDLVRGLLEQLNAEPRPLREAVFLAIGKTIGVLCHIGGWFIPMYGAGRLESHNIIEYERAAEYASLSGHHEMIDCILGMADVEREHELFFREKVTGHSLLRIFPMWKTTPVRTRAYAVR